MVGDIVCVGAPICIKIVATFCTFPQIDYIFCLAVHWMGQSMSVISDVMEVAEVGVSGHTGHCLPVVVVVVQVKVSPNKYRYPT